MPHSETTTLSPVDVDLPLLRRSLVDGSLSHWPREAREACRGLLHLLDAGGAPPPPPVPPRPLPSAPPPSSFSSGVFLGRSCMVVQRATDREVALVGDEASAMLVARVLNEAGVQVEHRDGRRGAVLVAGGR